MDDSRRDFLKKAAKYGWAIPVITSVMSSDARASLSGGYQDPEPEPNPDPPCDIMPRRRKHKHRVQYWWDQIFGDGNRHED
jgi:hypothetical protein